MDWGKLKRGNDMQDKYDVFIELYKTGVNKCSTILKRKENRCGSTQDVKKRAWIKIKRIQNQKKTKKTLR